MILQAIIAVEVVGECEDAAPDDDASVPKNVRHLYAVTAPRMSAQLAGMGDSLVLQVPALLARLVCQQEGVCLLQEDGQVLLIPLQQAPEDFQDRDCHS